jgi:hypothetical protein
MMNFYNGSSAYKDERPFLQSLLEKEHEHSFYLTPDSFFKISHGKSSYFITSLSFPPVKVGDSNVRILFHTSSLLKVSALLMNPSGPES